MSELNVISLTQTENYKKYKAIEKAGFQVVQQGEKLQLIDTKVPEAEKYVDLIFNSLNEILSVIAGYLLKAQIKVVA